MIIRFRDSVDSSLWLEVTEAEPAQVPRIGEHVKLPDRSALKVELVCWRYNRYNRSTDSARVTVTVDVYLI